MSVKIRLKRVGSHNDPVFRIVVADNRSPRDGKCIEEIGTYDPVKKDAPVKIDEAKALDWLKKGAIPSDTVRSLLSKAGIMKTFAAAK